MSSEIRREAREDNSGSSRRRNGLGRDPGPKPQKTALLVAQRIVEGLTTDGNQVGDMLPPERDMLEQYNVGRGTLREALRFLEMQGVLRIKPGPGGGPVVSSPDSRHLASTIALLLQVHHTPFRAVVEVRELLEPAMAGLAAVRATDEQIAEIGASMANMERTIGDRTAFLRYNAEFHDLIAWSSGNDLFGMLLTSLHWITDGTALGVDYSPRRQEAVMVAHQDIYDTIAARDADAAVVAMRSHVAEFHTYLEQKYSRLLDEPLRWNQLS